MATQNPIEQEGVYPLPEAQRDRFLMKIVVRLPDRRRGARDRLPDGRAAPGSRAGAHPGRADRACSSTADEVFVHNALVDYAVRLVLATRAPAEHGMPDVAQLIQYGASPRARRSASCARPGRWRCCAAATTRCRRTCRTSRRTSCATGWCSATTRSPTTSRPTTSSDRVLQTVPLPTVRPAPARRRRPYGSQHSRRPDPEPAGPAPQPAARPSRGRAAVHGPGADQRRDRSRPSPRPAGPRGGMRGARPAEAVLARLQLLITRKLDGLLQGDYLGLLPGPGSEAGESREYRPGDDVRRMDWPVTARTTVPHVRQTVADRELETWLAVDLSASLDFGTARCAQARPGDRRGRRDRAPDRARRQPDRRGGRHRHRSATGRAGTPRPPARAGRQATPGRLLRGVGPGCTRCTRGRRGRPRPSCAATR